MKYLLAILFLFFFCFAQAQYPITQKSNRYFKQEEMNDLYKETAREVFVGHKVPAAAFESSYPKLKDELIAESRKDIAQVFKWVESTKGAGMDAAPGSITYSENKALYVKYFKMQVVQAFDNSKQLQKYVSFSQSDRINYFNSHLTVKPDGLILVKEEISIYNGNGVDSNLDATYGKDNLARETGENNYDIKRGIIRNFPIKYVGNYQLNYNSTFKLVSVLVNGETAPYKSERHQNGISVQIGDANRELTAGNYTYTIIYETKYQIKYLDRRDELAWNVTGNGWGFRIDSAACTIQLPAGASIMYANCGAGEQGATQGNCEVVYNKKTDSLTARFATSKPLFPYKGLTVAISWNKGITTAPSTIEKSIRLLADNQLVFLYPILALLLIVYNTLAWIKVGRDPEAGNIIPTFYPPVNLSPAAMGYLLYQEFGNRFVSATIIDLAVRNKLVIDVAMKGNNLNEHVYTLKSSAKPEIKVAYEDYAQLGKALIGDTIQKGEYNSTLAMLRNKMESDCEKKYNDRQSAFFKLNYSYLVVGNAFIVLVFLYLKFFVFSFGEVFNYSPLQLLYAVCGLALCIIVQVFFYSIMPAYTAVGRKVLNEIEGFRMYLKAADEQRVNAMNPPEKSLELYERYMPFAIALACENEWGNQFAVIIAQATANNSAPHGYSSSEHSNFYSNILTASFVSSLGGSISSASIPPSSSSGGGFNVGIGGGGGGGSGW